MAQRRMIGKQVCGSDPFRSLSSAAQALYFQLLLEADDDGFVANTKGVVASCRALCKQISMKNVQELARHRFVIVFQGDLLCIKHFLIMNSIRKDRYVPTVYQKERENLEIKGNMAYTEKIKKKPEEDVNGCQTVARWLPNGCQVVAVDKDRIEEDSIGKIDPRARAREDQIDLHSPESRKIVSLYIKFNPRYTGTVSEEKVKDFLSRHAMEEFEDLIAKAKRSDYLCGITEAPVMSLEWVLEEENFAAVMSGRYENWSEDKKAPESFDSDSFFQAAVARGRKTLGKKN